MRSELDIRSADWLHRRTFIDRSPRLFELRLRASALLDLAGDALRSVSWTSWCATGDDFELVDDDAAEAPTIDQRSVATVESIARGDLYYHHGALLRSSPRSALDPRCLVIEDLRRAAGVDADDLDRRTYEAAARLDALYAETLERLSVRGLPAATEPLTSSPSPRSARPASRVPASPLARRIAREVGLRLESIDGSGRRGRITASDVLEIVTEDDLDDILPDDDHDPSWSEHPQELYDRELVRKALSGVARVGGRFDLGVVADLLIGASTGCLTSSGLASTTTFGVLTGNAKSWVQLLLRSCADAGLINGSELTELGRRVMLGQSRSDVIVPDRQLEDDWIPEDYE